MSDALTDIARDQERDSARKHYHTVLADWLENPTDDLHAKMMAAAAEVDSIRRGYFSGQTDLASRAATRAEKLKAGDELEWARLLTPLVQEGQHNWKGQVEERLYNLSPFKGRLLVCKHQGFGFDSYHADINKIFSAAQDKALAESNARRAANGANPGDYAGDYLFVVEAPAVSISGFKIR